jgi:PAT family beta-lactamase induction signal transducer AmpG
MAEATKIAAQTRVPVWLLGFCYAPMGLGGAISLMTVPQLLAANGVPEPQIASITAISLIPLFANILVAPLLDWRFSRRFYAILFLLGTAASMFAALLVIRNLSLLAALLFFGSLCVTLTCNAVGGWLSGLVSDEDKNRLGAWFTVANVTGFAVSSVLAIFLLRQFPGVLGAGLLGLLLLAPLPLFLILPAPPADSRLASESFHAFFGDVFALLRDRTVQWTLFLFIMPAASFALTNTLGGLGHDFDASERLVSLVGGFGGMLAGILGSLIVPRLIRDTSPLVIYLCIGAVGALFTLALIALPRTPVTFAIALIGEDGFQAAAFSVQLAIVLRTIGNDNPFAATQFALLSAVAMVPLTYMQAIDGNAYGLGGLLSTYATDGLLALGASLSLGLLFWLAHRRGWTNPAVTVA